MIIIASTPQDLAVANQAIARAFRARPVVLVEMVHSDLFPYCSDCTCPCHSEDGQADLGDALIEGRIADRDAGAAFYGEKPIRPRVA
jgi:hypothetical protein